MTHPIIIPEKNFVAYFTVCAKGSGDSSRVKPAYFIWTWDCNETTYVPSLYGVHFK